MRNKQHTKKPQTERDKERRVYSLVEIEILGRLQSDDRGGKSTRDI